MVVGVWGVWSELRRRVPGVCGWLRLAGTRGALRRPGWLLWEIRWAIGLRRVWSSCGWVVFACGGGLLRRPGGLGPSCSCVAKSVAFVSVEAEVGEARYGLPPRRLYEGDACSRIAARNWNPGRVRGTERCM